MPDDIKPKEKADIAYFAGCTASYCERDIAEGTVRLLGAPPDLLRPLLCCGGWQALFD